MRRSVPRPVWAGLLVLALPLRPIVAQDPSPLLTRVLEAVPIPAVELSPDRTRLLIMERPALPRLPEPVVPEVRLAGIRINPRNNAPSRARTYSALIVTPIGKGDPRRIVIPWQSRVGQVLWSPDGQRVAFTIVEDAGVSLWVAEASSGAIRMLVGPSLNVANSNPCQWVPSGTALLCTRIPSARPPAPPLRITGVPGADAAASDAPYDDLLQNPQDESALEYFLTSQLSLISLTGTERPVGKPGLYWSAKPSPDGKYILVESVERPFSRRVPLTAFPRRMEVWDLSGSNIRVLAEGTRPDTSGPRDFAWRGDAPATLVWAEVRDRVGSRARDRILMLDAPFEGTPRGLADLEFRGRGILWGRADLAVVREGWDATKLERAWAVDPSRPGARRLLYERSAEDRYADPGGFLTQPSPDGTTRLVLSRDGASAYLAGTGASLEGDRPFLDRMDLATGKTVRLWRAEGPAYEEVVALLDPDAGRMISRRESPSDAPNYFIRDLRARKGTPAVLTAVTRFQDPSPEFSGVSQQLISFLRKDGVRVSGALYLPPGYERKQGPIPFFVSTSTREFRSSRAASQVAGSPYRFVRPQDEWHRLLLLAGYGVLDCTEVPIVLEAEGGGVERPAGRDAWVSQLVASAQAAVDKLVALGVADPRRIAVGNLDGSGEVTTAELLAHSELFRAGIAWSGGADGDRAPALDPADRVDEPLLLIHRMVEPDSGTAPVSAERLFAPLKSTGATVRLVAAEPDGYRPRASLVRPVQEMVSWLDRYVKGVP